MSGRRKAFFLDSTEEGEGNFPYVETIYVVENWFFFFVFLVYDTKAKDAKCRRHYDYHFAPIDKPVFFAS